MGRWRRQSGWLRILEQHGTREAAGGADADQAVARPAAIHLAREGREDAPAGGGERMADRDRRAAYVEARRVDAAIWQPRYARVKYRAVE